MMNWWWWWWIDDIDDDDDESFIYDMRSNVSEYGNFEKYIDPNVKG